MKKFLLISILSLFTAFSIVSCSSDRDDDTTELQARYNVTGTWDFAQYKNESGVWTSMSVLGYYIKFNSDNTYSTNYLGEADAGTYTYDKKDLIITTSPEFGTSHIKIVSMTSTDAEAYMFDPADPADRIELRFKKR